MLLMTKSNQKNRPLHTDGFRKPKINKAIGIISATPPLSNKEMNYHLALATMELIKLYFN